MGSEWIVEIEEIYTGSEDPDADFQNEEKKMGFFVEGKDNKEIETVIVTVGVMPENDLAVDLFDLCDLNIQSSFGGAYAIGFKSSDLIQLMKDVVGVDKNLREDTLRRLKIMGSVAAESFNKKTQASK